MKNPRVANRILRFLVALAAAAGFALFVVIFALAVLVRERQALARGALAKIAAKTGAAVTVRTVDFGISTRGLELVAHDANVNYKNDRAHVERLTAIVGYGELTRMQVTPLEDVSMTSAVIALAPQTKSQPVDLRHYMAMLPHAAAEFAKLARRVNLMRVAVEPSGQPNAKLTMDLRIDADAERARVNVERLAWNGPPADGFSARALFTVPSAPAQITQGTIAFLRRATDRVQGSTSIRIAREAMLDGDLRLALSAPGLPGATSFAGTYSARQDRLELDGTLQVGGKSRAVETVPLRIALGEPFSNNPMLTAAAGPLDVAPALFARLLGRLMPAIGGYGRIGAANLALALGPVRSAIAACRDAPCETRHALAAVIAGADASLTITGAHLSNGRPGLGAIDLDTPLRVTFRDGMVNADGLNASAGAIAVKRGSFTANLQKALSSPAPTVVCSMKLFSAVDLGGLDLQTRIPARARRLAPHRGVAYSRVSFDSAFVNDGSGFKPQRLQAHVRQGFLWLRDRGRHEAIMFGADASLAGGQVAGAAHASLPAGGTILVHARYGLAARKLRAQFDVSGLDVRRWTDAALRADAVSGLSIAGEANGKAALEWSPALAQPHVSASVALRALTVGSRFMSTSIFIKAARIAASNTNARATLEHVQAGAGDFNMRASVANFAAPRIDIAVTGRGFDFDVIRTARAAPPTRRAAAAPSPSAATLARHVTLRASVRLKRVFVHHVELRDFVCDIHGDGNRWELRRLTARALDGSLKIRAAWDARTRRVYAAADAYRLNVRRLLDGISPGNAPPVSGVLSGRLDAGLALFGGRQPEPLCGHSTIVMRNGTLGKIQLLSEIMQVASVTSWLRFNAPDFDTGMPYDRITIRTELTPHALEIAHAQLTSDLIGLAGHGAVKLPSRVLDLHVQALPLASVRWLLGHVPFVGERLGKGLNRVFAVRIRVSGPAAAPNVTPSLFRNPLNALTDVIDLPLDFVPESDLPDDSMFLPPRKLSYRKDCSPYQW